MSRVHPHRRTARALAGASAALAVALLAGCGADEPERVVGENVLQPGRPGEEATVLEPGTTLPPSEDPYAESDVAFLVQMIPHHAQALEMAQLAPGRAQDPRVVGMASRIADVQQLEIDVYERWLADKGLAPDGRPTGRAGGGGGEHGHGDVDTTAMPGMASEADLAALEAAQGTEFDRTWLRLMIAHHEGALAMAEEREATGTNIRVGELAADVVVTQLDEITTMQAVLDELGG
ncbi:DUF305 domain-containing protein [Angustibacter speluncae]